MSKGKNCPLLFEIWLSRVEIVREAERQGATHDDAVATYWLWLVAVICTTFGFTGAQIRAAAAQIKQQEGES